VRAASPGQPLPPRRVKPWPLPFVESHTAPESARGRMRDSPPRRRLPFAAWVCRPCAAIARVGGNSGTRELWDPGALELWNSGTPELWNSGSEARRLTFQRAGRSAGRDFRSQNERILYAKWPPGKVDCLAEPGKEWDARNLGSIPKPRESRETSGVCRNLGSLPKPRESPETGRPNPHPLQNLPKSPIPR
jgi:hypothetical protein